MNNQFSKELKFMKRFQTKIQEIKNYTESIGSRSNQCEDTISKLEDRDTFKDQFLRDTLKTTKDQTAARYHEEQN